MRKVHEKSILLGIGIGMIITAIAGMIFYGGTQKELSKEEIISIAKTKYGLIEQVPLLNGDNVSNDSTNSPNNDSSTQSTMAQSSSTESTAAKSTETESTAAKSTETESTVAKSTATKSTVAKSTVAKSTATKSTAALTDKQQESSSNTTTDRNIIIKINDGSKAYYVIEQLFNKKVISNREEFTKVLESNGLYTKIRVGTYKFRENDDFDYIINTICKLK